MILISRSKHLAPLTIFLSSEICGHRRDRAKAGPAIKEQTGTYTREREKKIRRSTTVQKSAAPRPGAKRTLALAGKLFDNGGMHNMSPHFLY